jgi:hypothetical protein
MVIHFCVVTAVISHATIEELRKVVFYTGQTPGYITQTFRPSESVAVRSPWLAVEIASESADTARRQIMPRELAAS